MEHTESFKLDRSLDDETYELLYGLAKTRRMKRDEDVLKQANENADFGIEGEFYFNPFDFENNGQSLDSSILDYNEPPGVQPTLWLQWFPTLDKGGVVWNGNGYCEGAPEWIAYMIYKILEPRGYILNGTVNVSNSLVLTIENNQLYQNRQLINVLSTLMNIESRRIQIRLPVDETPYRILKMKMAPHGKLAIEIEDTGFELIAVVSHVKNQFSLEQFSREVLCQYSGAIQFFTKPIDIRWTDDSTKAAIYISGDVVSVIDFTGI